MSDLPPIVSVIMPCFNQGQFIEEAVESVIAQTFTPVEIIIINDGSTDIETVRLLKHYQKPNVSVIHTDNQGPSAARNLGIQQAKGRYILPVDADDRIGPTYLEKAVPILESQPEVGIVYAQAELFGAKTGSFDLPPYQFPDILLGNMIFNSSLYRKADWERAGGYNENMVWGWEDYDFWLAILELGRDVFYIPEVLYFHREVENSRSQQMTQEHWVKSYTQIFQNHPQLYFNHIGTLFKQLVELRGEVHGVHSQLHEAHSQLHEAHSQLHEVHSQLHEAHNEVHQVHSRLHTIVTTVQTSKAWKVRKRWLKLKQQLGIKVDAGDALIS
ncbi:glycosyltransferase family 2 protein [Phormidium sp. CLA17]|uniref:glycosyltransferase family A protein n=1 Tax=Leptolyngbya sp. Cla-17 TaxID=2803751 RepID=UPI001491A2B2|nr:glycosyltransferase family A protein [Leptolyngbya sp. Cla-17]MBM0740844.1 glycosyltransferase family 2 protein [Leptolyngbya sp. Cla-17]